MIAFVGSVFAIVLLTNVALWLRLVPRLLNTDSTALDYGWAWAPWPTRIRVHDLVISGQDQNVQFAIAVDETWLTLDLWSVIADRTIKVTKMRGSGTSVRVLQRLQPWNLQAAKIRALPPIPGRKSPPLTEDYVQGPRATRAFYDQLSIEVNDVDAMAKEVWIDDVRFQGQIRALGSFLLRPGLELRVGPGAEAQIRSGELSVGGRPTLAAMSGRADCNTPNFNPSPPQGLAIAGFFTGSLLVRARLVDLDVVNYVAAASGIQARGGTGSFNLDVSFVRGVLRPNSKLKVTSRALEIDLAGQRLNTSLELDGAIDQSEHGTVRLTTTELTVGPVAQRARLGGGRLTFDLATRSAVDLAHPSPDASFAATLTKLTGETEALRAYMPADSPLALDEGQLLVEGEVSGTTTRPDLLAQLRARANIKAHAAQRRFHGTLSAFGRASQTERGYDLGQTSLDVSDLQVVQGKDVTYGWWSHVEITDGGYVNGESPHLAVQLKGLLRDIQPLYVAMGPDIDIPTWLQGLLPLKGTRFAGHVAVEAGALRVGPFSAESGALHIQGKLKKPKGQEPTGALRVVSGPLSFGVAFSPGKSGTELLATDAWFESQP